MTAGRYDIYSVNEQKRISMSEKGLYARRIVRNSRHCADSSTATCGAVVVSPKRIL